jgi:hypothetical protein
MLRLAWIIIGLTAIGAAVVHLRCRQAQGRAESEHLENQRLLVHQKLWDQQIRLGDLSTPQNVRRLTLDWAIDLVSPEEAAKDPLRGRPGAPASPAGGAGRGASPAGGARGTQDRGRDARDTGGPPGSGGARTGGTGGGTGGGTHR